MPADASRLYARNVTSLLLLMTVDGEVVPDFDDEVVAGACLTHDGVVRHRPHLGPSRPARLGRAGEGSAVPAGRYRVPVGTACRPVGRSVRPLGAARRWPNRSARVPG